MTDNVWDWLDFWATVTLHRWQFDAHDEIIRLARELVQE